MHALGERTIWLDCDVISLRRHAHGQHHRRICCPGRGAQQAQKKQYHSNVSIPRVGCGNLSRGCQRRRASGPDDEEDSQASVDMNVVMTDTGRYIEVQGTAEGTPFDRQRLNRMLDLAHAGIRELLYAQRAALGDLI